MKYMFLKEAGKWRVGEWRLIDSEPSIGKKGFYVAEHAYQSYYATRHLDSGSDNPLGHFKIICKVEVRGKHDRDSSGKECWEEICIVEMRRFNDIDCIDNIIESLYRLARQKIDVAWNVYDELPKESIKERRDARFIVDGLFVEFDDTVWNGVQGHKTRSMIWEPSLGIMR